MAYLCARSSSGVQEAYPRKSCEIESSELLDAQQCDSGMDELFPQYILHHICRVNDATTITVASSVEWTNFTVRGIVTDRVIETITNQNLTKIRGRKCNNCKRKIITVNNFRNGFGEVVRDERNEERNRCGMRVEGFMRRWSVKKRGSVTVFLKN